MARGYAQPDQVRPSRSVLSAPLRFGQLQRFYVITNMGDLALTMLDKPDIAEVSEWVIRSATLMTGGLDDDLVLIFAHADVAGALQSEFSPDAGADSMQSRPAGAKIAFTGPRTRMQRALA